MVSSQSTIDEIQKSALLLAPGQWAGHMRIYQRESKSLLEAGYSVDLIAHPFLSDILDPRIRLHSLGSLPKDSYSWKILQRLERSTRTYNSALSIKADLLHFFSPEFIPWAVNLKKRKQVPLIFDSMEDFESYVLQRKGKPEKAKPILSLITRKLLEYGARNSDAMIFSDIGTSKKFANIAKRSVVIHNFPDLRLFNPKIKYNVKKDFDLVFYGGVYSIFLTQCFHIDEELVNRGYKLKWLFFGLVPEEKWVKDQLVTRNLTDRFIFNGLVSQEKVAEKISQAKIGIIPLPDTPKYRNNIPQKLFEFMSMGLPVVMSDLPPSRNLIDHKECAILVKPDDYCQFAENIISLLENRKYFNEFASKGRYLVLNEFNWQKESIKLLHLYEELLN